MATGIAQSVERLATDMTVRGSDPGEGEIFVAVQTEPPRLTQPPVNRYRVFPWDKEARAWC